MMNYTPEAKAFARKLADSIEQDKEVSDASWNLLHKLLSI